MGMKCISIGLRDRTMNRKAPGTGLTNLEIIFSYKTFCIYLPASLQKMLFCEYQSCFMTWSYRHFTITWFFLPVNTPAVKMAHGQYNRRHNDDGTQKDYHRNEHGFVVTAALWHQRNTLHCRVRNCRPVARAARNIVRQRRGCGVLRQWRHCCRRQYKVIRLLQGFIFGHFSGGFSAATPRHDNVTGIPRYS